MGGKPTQTRQKQMPFAGRTQRVGPWHADAHQICIAAANIEIDVLAMLLLDGSLCRFPDRFYACSPPRRQRAV